MNFTKISAGLVSGLLFGAGLAVAGMTNPNKVLNFLDVTGGWDPSLALVMAAAIPIAALAFWIGRRRPRPLFDVSFVLPSKTRIEPALLIGSALFGLGWGLGGYCPGPAVASLSHPNMALLGFLLAMGLGLMLSPAIARHVPSRRESLQASASSRASNNEVASS
jgi:uncharacterized membrane protein YedE/YeeE